MTEHTHIESRKMVLMNQSAGQHCRGNIENRPTDRGQREGAGETMARAAWKHIHTMCKTDSQWEFAV